MFPGTLNCTRCRNYETADYSRKLILSLRLLNVFLLVYITKRKLLAALVRKILFLPLENKTHIFAPPCNILYIFYSSFGQGFI